MKRTIEERNQYTKIIAKAWVDEEFKKRLLEDPATVLKENGIVMPEGITVRFVERKKNEIHIPLPVKPDRLTDRELQEITPEPGCSHGAFLCRTISEL